MPTTELLPNYLDVTKLALASFMARYREPTLTAYQLDLKTYVRWCQANDIQPLRISRGELEMYVRHLEGRGHAPATVARRFGTVATFLKYAVVDGVIPANPADAVARPAVPWEGQRRTFLHPLEFAAVLSAARASDPNDHALICLLGMIGLRVSEACGASITDIRYESGYEILHVIGKGSKPDDIPLPIPVLRAVREATSGRHPAHAIAAYLAGNEHRLTTQRRSYRALPDEDARAVALALASPPRSVKRSRYLSGFLQPGCAGDDDRVGAVGHLQLAEDVRDVVPHCLG
jgi:integrase/recombinase XerD